ncbi:MAG: hypothetical protein JXB26_15500 [Candidatus Aminicenantes bacterium]|nr:hypothetical protein [Candidatus Aminicenantes bacterium]
MNVTIREVKTRKDLKTFIFLPEKIHAGHATWVPPIYMDEWSYFRAEKNDHFSYCDTIMLLAFREKKPVGRIMGIINHRYNELRNQKTARFGYLETGEDEELVRKLLRSVEEWAREKGMTRLIGPYGFSDQDPEGFLIEGFEERATIVTYHNYPWMPEMLEKMGYKKDVDYYVYKLEVPTEIPEFFHRIRDRVVRRGNFELVEFKKRREIKKWIKPFLHLMNEVYTESNIYGYSPLKEKEMEELARRYYSILDARFIKGVLKDGQVVAFIVGIPDMSIGIQKARGRLFPFGFIKILRSAKKTKQLDLLLGGIKKEYRRMGLDALMGVSVLMSAREAGFKFMDTHHELEENTMVRATMERMGGKVYKKFRVYQKVILLRPS